MQRILGVAGLAMLAATAGGCMSGPTTDSLALVRSQAAVVEPNPLYVPLGPTKEGYAKVFETTLDLLDDYFEISYANRYDGRIEAFARIAPGLEQPWREGSPDSAERLLATLQTIRHRAAVLIQPADAGGYFVQVTVLKELEDLPKPTRATAGIAAFRSDNTVERQFDVVDPTVFESNWIPVGRDTALEQVILQKLKKCM